GDRKAIEDIARGVGWVGYDDHVFRESAAARFPGARPAPQDGETIRARKIFSENVARIDFARIAEQRQFHASAPAFDESAVPSGIFPNIDRKIQRFKRFTFDAHLRPALAAVIVFVGNNLDADAIE